VITTPSDTVQLPNTDFDESMFSPPLPAKIQKVQAMLQGNKVLVAFSGGVDSSVMLALALKYADAAVAVHFDSIFNSARERENAERIAGMLGVDLRMIDSDPLACEDIRKNPVNRCYYCKKADYTELVHLKDALGYDMIVDGTNTDDLMDHRPGFQAMNSLGIRSPLLEAQLVKAEIREIARALYLPNSEKPGNPCLASRVMYGIEISRDMIERVDRAEEEIARTIDAKVIRARVHEHDLLRIELDRASLAQLLSGDASELLDLGDRLKDLGFKKVSLDLEGYRTGSLNELVDTLTPKLDTTDGQDDTPMPD
jgi:uncharacterized protein